MPRICWLLALLLVLEHHNGKVYAGVYSCTDQRGCIEISEHAPDAGDPAACYKVCLTFKRGCGKTDPMSNVCGKDCHSAAGTKMPNFPLDGQLCLYGDAGDTLTWVVKDASGTCIGDSLLQPSCSARSSNDAAYVNKICGGSSWGNDAGCIWKYVIPVDNTHPLKGCPKTCASSNVCRNPVCDSNGDCVDGPVADNTPCDSDNDACTTQICQSGSCVRGPDVTCGTAPFCQIQDACVPASGCPSPRNKDDGTSCETDEDECTTEVCEGGSCVPGPDVTCPAALTCQTQGECVSPSGCPDPTNVANGTPCDSDSDACTTQICQGGTCVLGPDVICEDAPICKIQEECVSPSGCPDPTNMDDGTSCETDENECTTETCQDGKCVRGADVTCATAPTCKIQDECVPASGCPTPRIAPEGTLCDDKVQCTVDQCDGQATGPECVTKGVKAASYVVVMQFNSCPSDSGDRGKEDITAAVMTLFSVPSSDVQLSTFLTTAATGDPCTLVYLIFDASLYLEDDTAFVAKLDYLKTEMFIDTILFKATMTVFDIVAGGNSQPVQEQQTNPVDNSHATGASAPTTATESNQSSAGLALIVVGAVMLAIGIAAVVWAIWYASRARAMDTLFSDPVVGVKENQYMPLQAPTSSIIPSDYVSPHEARGIPLGQPSPSATAGILSEPQSAPLSPSAPKTAPQ